MDTAPPRRKRPMPVSKKPRKKKAARKTSAVAPPSPQLPDRRAMEGFLAQLGGQHLNDALSQAQNIMYDAWDAPTRQRRVTLARKALKVSPLCADAYVLLAEEDAKTLEDARALYVKGVESGALALGERAFVEDVGHFWGILETRPYMRARCGLAQALWVLGEQQAAIDHYQDMLRLNPNDNQGIRYLLVSCLLEVGDDAAIETLLNDYEGDIAAEWAYSKALLAYRQRGDTEQARKLLTEAWTANAYVPAYLTGKKRLPDTSPDYISIGGEDEAVSFVHHAGTAWRKTEGAIAWLAKMVSDLPPPETARSTARH